MADNSFKTGDNQYNILRKILATLIAGGGGGGGGTVTVADGADVAEGSKSDAANTDSTSAWSVVSLLKGIWAKLNGGVAVSGNVGGKTTVIKDTSAVTAAGYSAGNAVGGKRTLVNALTSVGTGVLESIIVLDRANQKAALDIFIFDADPVAATITDKTAFVFSTDDLKVIAHVSVAAADYVTVNSKAIAHESSLGIALKASGTSLYAAVVTSGTPTFAAVTDVQVTFGILQD